MYIFFICTNKKAYLLPLRYTSPMITMPKWSKDTIIFPVKVAYANKGKKRFGRIVLPKPIIKLLAFPEEVCFELRNGEIILRTESA